MEKFRDEVSIIRLGVRRVKHTRAYMTRKKIFTLHLTLSPGCGSVQLSGHRRRCNVSFTTMSTELPQKVQSRVDDGRITIVAARYNEKYTDALLQNCLDELAETAPDVEVEVVRVPGAFEVPMMVKRAIEQPVSGETPDAVIAFGVILRGSTAHADLIGTAITNQLMSQACESLVPVIHEVLLLSNEEQAFARCIASSLNRGREAARAALEMLNVLQEQKDEMRYQARRNSVSRTGSLI